MPSHTRWKGIVSHDPRKTMMRTFAAANSPQKTSSPLLCDRNVITDIPDRHDHAASKLRPQPADVDIHDIGAGIERPAPDLFEEFRPAEHLALMAHEVVEQ